ASAGTQLWLDREGRLTLDWLTARLLTIAREGVRLSLVTTERAEVRAWMQRAEAPHAASLPAKLDALPRKGCHLYDIDAHPVSLECFMLANGDVMHLFTIPTSHLRDAPGRNAPPQVAAHEGFNVATWARDGKALIFLSSEPIETIRALLS
ncbi:MAG: hypothetical protein WCF18_16800, partial [Chthoniobacteraceae bacterium]